MFEIPPRVLAQRPAALWCAVLGLLLGGRGSAMSQVATNPPPLSVATGLTAHAAAWFAQARERGLDAGGVLLRVSVADQRLAVVTAQGVSARFVISTSKWGVGGERDSQRTPLGWHEVADRIGGDRPPGQLFVSRLPLARVLPPAEWRATAGDDYVLTRILHLRGLEPGVNLGGSVDSYARFIYLHGTNQEQLLGQPASHGCVRLSNRDMLALFDLTEGHATYCWIVETSLVEG